MKQCTVPEIHLSKQQLFPRKIAYTTVGTKKLSFLSEQKRYSLCLQKEQPRLFAKSFPVRYRVVPKFPSREKKLTQIK